MAIEQSSNFKDTSGVENTVSECMKSNINQANWRQEAITFSGGSEDVSVSGLVNPDDLVSSQNEFLTEQLELFLGLGKSGNNINSSKNYSSDTSGGSKYCQISPAVRSFCFTEIQRVKELGRP